MHCRNHPEVVEGTRARRRCGIVFCRDCLVETGGEPFCATCKTERVLDLRSADERVPLRYATPLRRLGALILDFFIEALPLQTPGRTVAKVRVVRIDGTRVTAREAWLRSVTKGILSSVCCITFIPAFFSSERATLHDMIAGTRVIEDS